MTSEVISVKLEETFLGDIDSIIKNERYKNRTEFVQNALKEKVEEIRLKKIIAELSKLKGMVKRKITEEDYERAREKAFEEISKKFI